MWYIFYLHSILNIFKMLFIDFVIFIKYTINMENMLNIVNSFKIFGFEVKFYGITMALSYLIAFIVCIILCKKKQYNEKLPYRLLLLVFPLAVIGGRLGYVVFSGRSWTIAEIINIRSGGLMLYGGIVFALLGVVIYAICRKQNVLRYFDLIAPCLIIAIAVGRWGNFFNQEAYGVAVTNPKLHWFPFAVYIENSLDISKWHLATFFYESVWCILSFFVIYFVYKKTERTGLSTALFLFLYGIERFFVEGFRTDSLYLANTGIRVSQLVSALMVGLAVGYFIFLFVVKLQEKKYRKLHPQLNLYQDESLEVKNAEFNLEESQITAEKPNDNFIYETPIEENTLLNSENSLLNEEKLQTNNNNSLLNSDNSLLNAEYSILNENSTLTEESNQIKSSDNLPNENPVVSKRLQRIKEQLSKQRSDFVSEKITQNKQLKQNNQNQNINHKKETENTKQVKQNEDNQQLSQEKVQKQVDPVVENSPKVNKRVERIKEQLSKQRNKK